MIRTTHYKAIFCTLVALATPLSGFATLRGEPPRKKAKVEAKVEPGVAWMSFLSDSAIQSTLLPDCDDVCLDLLSKASKRLNGLVQTEAKKRNQEYQSWADMKSDGDEHHLKRYLQNLRIQKIRMQLMSPDPIPPETLELGPSELDELKHLVFDPAE